VLLRDASVSPLLIEPLLNELDYGDFEGAPFLDYAPRLQRHGPWVRPPGAGESQREGIQRMLCGLSATLEQSGPRVVVAHGLLLSVLGWHLSCAPGTAIPLFFPEAAHLAPLTMADGPLGTLVDRLLGELDSQSGREPRLPQGNAGILGMEAPSILATVDSLPTPLEEKPPHA
jgi:probable phosphoglycerate mutase